MGWLREPLAMVDALWDGSGESTVASVASEVGLVASDEATMRQVPLLTRAAYVRGTIQPRRLLRWVGMVQDTGPFQEFCFAGTPDRCALYRAEAFDGARVHELCERTQIWGVAAPGQSAWAQIAGPTVEPELARQRPTKRPRDDDDCDDEDLEPQEGDPPKKSRLGEQMDVPGGFQHARDDDDPVECLISVYGREAPRINQLVEVVGLLAAAPVPGGDDPWDDEWEPVASEVARVHALWWRRLDEQHPAAPPTSRWEDSRALALGFLTKALYGDAATAEYVLLALLGKPNLPDRHGSLSLDLVVDDALRKPVAARLRDALSLLVPRCLLVKASEAKPPVRDVEAQRLQPSPLQVVDATALVFDFDLTAAPQYLADVISCPREVMYDFGFGAYKPFPLDARVFVVTRNRKGTAGDCVVAPHFAAATSDVDEATLLSSSSSQLEPVRDYIAAARNSQPKFDETVAKTLTDAFVRARAKGEIPAKEAEQRLTNWLTLCRLDAKSRGDATIDQSHWERVQHLERFRVVRYASAKRAAGLD